MSQAGAGHGEVRGEMIRHEFADVNGVRIHYAIAGPAEADTARLILFLHGFPEFWYAWRCELEEFGGE
jgi:pimeloyl-ACP methyl ester carboxylesterase